MRAEHIEVLLAKLGCRRIYRTAGGVRSTCPMSHRHRGGKDKHPSFYVYTVDDDMSHCRCMSASCAFKGSLNDLLFKIQKDTKRNMANLFTFVQTREEVDIKKRLDRIDGNKSFYAPKETSSDSPPAAWTGGKDYSDPLVLMAAHSLNEESLDYLHGPDRRFTDETIKKWKIGWHPIARRISSPQYDCLGRLVNIGGRFIPYWPEWVPIESKAPKWMHSLGFERELYLFGENWFELSDDGTGTVFITEGAFDVIYLDQCGIPNVAGVNGSYINKPQIEKIVRWFSHAVILMDGDDAGKDASDRLRHRLSSRMEVSVFDIEGGRDPNQLEDDEVDFLKDRFLS